MYKSIAVAKWLVFAVFILFTQDKVHGAEEEFYILDVGLGNSQLAVFRIKDTGGEESTGTPAKRIGAIYDCGTSSSLRHPKYKNFSPEEDTLFLRKKESIDSTPARDIIPSHLAGSETPLRKPRLSRSRHQDKPDFNSSTIIGPTDLSLGTPPLPSLRERLANSPYRSRQAGRKHQDRKPPFFDFSPPLRGRESLSASTGTTRELKKGIHDLLTSKSLDHLFIFLSHPDSDHINLLVDGGALPEENLRVTAYLCGDWLGHAGESKSGDKRSQAVSKVMKHLFSRPHTQVELPYYWGLKGDDGAKGTGYRPLLSMLTDAFNRSVSYDALENQLPETLRSHSPSFFQGNLTTLLRMTSEHNIIEPELSANLNHEDGIGSHFHIWGMNLPASDPNNQSLVLSCTFPSLKFSAVMTGDAHESVFQHIVDRSRGVLDNPEANVLRSTLRLPEDHQVLLMLPHHGSRHNISDVMDNFFQPDIVAISAGNGRMYRGAHPHISVIDHYIPQRTQKFWKTYDLVDDYGFLAFGEEERIIAAGQSSQQITKGYRVKLRDGRRPILCTNIYGTIKVTNRGFSYQLSNTFEIGGNMFCAELDEHVLQLKRKKKGIVRALSGKYSGYKKVALRPTSNTFLFEKTIRKNTHRLLAIPVENEGPKWYFYVVREYVR